MKGYFRLRNCKCEGRKKDKKKKCTCGAKWSFTIDIGRDENGKRKQKIKSGFNTKKEAERACAEMIVQIENGQYNEPTEMTMKDFFHYWLENHYKYKVAPSTYEPLTTRVQNKIIPLIGRIKLKELKPYHVEKFHNDLFNQGLGEQSVATLHSIVSRALTYAVKQEMIIKNPCSIVGKPRIPNKDYTVWDIKDCHLFLSYTRENEPYQHIAYFLAIYTGMRRSELLGLTWNNVDFTKNKIYVNQTLYYKNKQDFTFAEPKTKKSKRAIAIDETIITELKAHRKRINQDRLLYGPDYKEHDLVCCNYEGLPLIPNDLGDHFRKMLTKVDVPKIRFHDLRHTHATILLRIGENPKVIQERLGHASIQITLDTYSHVLPDMQENTMSAFSKAMTK